MNRYIQIALATAAASFIALVASCAISPSREGGSAILSQGKSGAQLWSESCARCHNFRPVTAYTDNQWDVIALHMRVRANLTAEENREIFEFLKSSN